MSCSYNFSIHSHEIQAYIQIYMKSVQLVRKGFLKGLSIVPLSYICVFTQTPPKKMQIETKADKGNVSCVGVKREC